MKWLIWSVLLPSIALGQNFSGAWDPQTGIESLSFQNGVSPSAAYSGCTDTWLDSNNTTTNNDGSDLTVALNTDTSLLRFDIDAIPDNAVIAYAELRLSMTAETFAFGSDTRLQCYRVMRDWVEDEATWAARKDPVADSTWSSAGALDASTNLALFGEAGGKEVDTRLGNYDTDWDRSTLTFGADSLFSGYASDDIDICCANDDYGGAGLQVDGVVAEGTDVPKRVRVRVTDLVRGWHTGIWANYGLALADIAQVMTASVTFADSEDATTADRPELIVYYRYATVSSGGSGGTGTIAGAGPTP